MNMEAFKLLVRALVKSGYGDIDPELKLYYLVIEDDIPGISKHLSGSGWSNGTYSTKITVPEIVARYRQIINMPWVQANINKLRAQQGNGRTA